MRSEKQIFEYEDAGYYVDGNGTIAGLAADELDQNIGYKTQADTLCDGK